MKKPQCKPADISIVNEHGTIEVAVFGRHLLSTNRALKLTEGQHAPVYYIPSTDLPSTMSLPSDKTTYCPYKGHARYFHLHVDERRAPNAVWFYPDPCPLVSEIKNHVAFWGDDVVITVK